MLLLLLLLLLPPSLSFPPPPPPRFTLSLPALQITVRTVGKAPKGSNNGWITEGYEQYRTRLKPAGVDLDTVRHRDDEDLEEKVRGDLKKGHAVILLDPKGETLTSERFAATTYKALESGGSRLTFVIGGAAGLPPLLLSDAAYPRVTLSALTFTHQFALVLLAEQVYRAAEIRKGSGYHK